MGTQSHVDGWDRIGGQALKEFDQLLKSSPAFRSALRREAEEEKIQNRHRLNAIVANAVGGQLTLSGPVGNKRVLGSDGNAPDDVLAVQAALKGAHMLFPAQVKKNGAQAPVKRFSADPINVDGVYSQSLVNAIENVQEWFLPHSVNANGVFREDRTLTITNQMQPDTYVGRSQHKASTYTFACLKHILQAKARRQTSSSGNAVTMVRLLKTKLGQPYILGAAVPKYLKEWMGPWDCAEYVAWGLYQTMGSAYARHLNAGMIGSFAGGYHHEGNGVKYHNASAGIMARQFERLHAINPRICSEVTNAAEIKRTPGLIGTYNGTRMAHVFVTDGNSRTLEAHYWGKCHVGSRALTSSLRNRYRFWKIHRLY